MLVKDVVLRWSAIGVVPGMKRDQKLVPHTRELLTSRKLDPDDLNQVFRFLQGGFELANRLLSRDLAELTAQHGDAAIGSHEYIAMNAQRYYAIMRYYLAGLVPPEILEADRCIIEDVPTELLTPDDWHAYDLVPRVEAAYADYISDPTAPAIVVVDDPYFYDAAYCVFQGTLWLTQSILSEIIGARVATEELRQGLRSCFKNGLPSVHPEVMAYVAL